MNIACEMKSQRIARIKKVNQKREKESRKKKELLTKLLPVIFCEFCFCTIIKAISRQLAWVFFAMPKRLENLSQPLGATVKTAFGHNMALFGLQNC